MGNEIEEGSVGVVETKYKLFPRPRDYTEEQSASAVEFEDVGETDHPLPPGEEYDGPVKREVDEAGPSSSSSGDDPLADPLSGSGNVQRNSVMATAGGKMGVFTAVSKVNQTKNTGGYEVKTDEVRDALMFRNKEWDATKPKILEKYTVRDQISVSFMQDVTGGKVEKEDTLENRLDELDLNEADKTKEEKELSLSQQEYMKHIESLHSNLIEAWETDQRVKSLKIAIQMAKLLGDTSVPHFYPSKFVLVTEILDTFGKLVFERIRQRAKAFVGVDNAAAAAVAAEKATSRNLAFTEATQVKSTAFGEMDNALKEFFVINDVADVPEQAKETCRNWFYKIASIRELLPRLYVEMSIMRCYTFLTNESYDKVISRLCGMARGLADPLVSAYCIAYLCRKGREMAPENSEYLVSALSDLMTSFRLLNTTQTSLRDSYIQKHKMPLVVWMDLFSPALDWLTQCLAPLQTKQNFNLIMKKYEEHQEGIVLHHLIEKFRPEFLSEQALNILRLVNKAQVESYPKHLLLSELGDVCCKAAPPNDHRLVLLNDVWTEVRKMQDNPEAYLAVADAWLYFTLCHFTDEEVNVCLADILGLLKQHLHKVDSEDMQEHLHSIIQHLLGRYDFVKLCSMEKFLPLLDNLKGASQLEVNKAILVNFSKLTRTISDQLIINVMFSVGKVVHDSVNSLTMAEDKAEVTELCIAFIRGVDFGRDVEKHLNFFVECRRSFANLDKVKKVLVLGVCKLIMKTHGIIKGQHNKKTAAFIRACVAYCYITIPMIDDVMDRLYLYVMAGQLAVANQSLHQAEAMLQGAINLLPEMPPSTTVDGHVVSHETELTSLAKYIVSTLVVIPGHPDKGPFYLLHDLLEKVREYPWTDGSTALAEIYIAVLQMLFAVSQNNIPVNCQVPSMETNVELYKGDVEYTNEILTLQDKLVVDVMEMMASWKEKNQNTTAARVALDLFNVTTRLAEMNGTSATLAGNLCMLAKRLMEGGEVDSKKYFFNSVDYLQYSENRFCSSLYQKLHGDL